MEIYHVWYHIYRSYSIHGRSSSLKIVNLFLKIASNRVYANIKTSTKRLLQKWEVDVCIYTAEIVNTPMGAVGPIVLKE